MESIYSKLFAILLYFHNTMQERAKVVTLQNEQTGIEDKYLLMPHPLGEGRYAKVYKAVNLRDSAKAFAVKVIRMQSEQVRKEYLRELRIIKNLPDCPNLVKTHRQHLQSENNLYIFQQYCELGTLINFRIQRGEGPLAEEQIYDLFFQVSNGLITLLNAGIVHEDIKPANVLKKGRVFKLCDFGVSELGVQCKETTTRKGTISYMPPQKLKSRRFLPNQKSDIYSLGTCIYEVVFGFHPYLKKKTANYKEYLVALEEAKLKPISQLMKIIGSSSLRLENFLKFLERMIDLNCKTRVSLQELKQFLATTEPFKSMTVAQEHQENKIQGYKIQSDQLMNAFQSVIRFRKDNQDHLLVTTDKQQSQNDVYSIKSQQKIEQQSLNQEIVLRQKILEQFQQENHFIVGMIGYLSASVDSIRKCNFNNLNILPTGPNNFARIDLSDCKVSRYLKYLIFEFAVSLRRREREVYEQYLSEDRLMLLSSDMSYLQNQFNKFLIQSNFANKQQLCLQLTKRNSVELWREIVRILEECLSNLTLVKENKIEDLKCVLFCCTAPKILEAFSNLSSIFSQIPLRDQLIESQEGNCQTQNGKMMLSRVLDLEREKLQVIREEVERELQVRRIDVLFDIDEDSGEIEVIIQQDLS